MIKKTLKVCASVIIGLVIFALIMGAVVVAMNGLGWLFSLIPVVTMIIAVLWYGMLGVLYLFIAYAIGEVVLNYRKYK